jgi:hypothetical protein
VLIQLLLLVTYKISVGKNDYRYRTKCNWSDLDGNLSLGLGHVIAGGGERVLRIGQHFPVQDTTGFLNIESTHFQITSVVGPVPHPDPLGSASF